MFTMVAHGMDYWLLKKPFGVNASTSKIIILGVIRRGTTGFTIQGLEIMFLFFMDQHLILGAIGIAIVSISTNIL